MVTFPGAWRLPNSYLKIGARVERFPALAGRGGKSRVESQKLKAKNQMHEKDLTQRAPRSQSSRRNRKENCDGWVNGRSSVDLLGFAGHVVHEEILAEGVGSGEVGFAAAHFGDFLDEMD